jgi:hypothetical protein
MQNSFSFNGLTGLQKQLAAAPALRYAAPNSWRRLKELLALSANEC